MIHFTLFDQAKDGLTAMARTTACMAVLGTQFLIQGRITQKGIVPPENMGAELLDDVISGLRAQGIVVNLDRKPLEKRRAYSLNKE